MNSINIIPNPCRAVDISLQFVLFCFSVLVCQALFVGQPTVHLQAIVSHHLYCYPSTGHTLSYISSSVIAITSTSLQDCLPVGPYLADFRLQLHMHPFSFGTPIFCRTQTLLLYSQFIMFYGCCFRTTFFIGIYL